MSEYTLYDASLVMGRDALASLENVVKKAAASSKAAAIPTARIHEDMLPFTYQVHSVLDNVQKMASRFAGETPVALPNDLATFEQMLARIAEVRARLDAAPAREAVNAKATDVQTIGLGPGRDASMQMWQYVHGYILPNLFFHLVTAYDIARKEGVELGKMDFISPFMGKFLGA